MQIDTTFLIALVAAVLAAASMVLHVVAPRTKNTIDDKLRDDIDEALVFIRGANPSPAPDNVAKAVAGAITKAVSAGAILVIVLFLTACAGTGATIKADLKAFESKVVACAKADAGPIAEALGALTLQATVSYATTGAIDVHALEASALATAKTQGVAVAGCSFGPLVSWIVKLFPPAADGGAQGLIAAPTPAADAQAALARFKAATGVTTIQTANGSI